MSRNGRNRPTRDSDMRELYHHLLRIRRFEERVSDLRASNDIVGSVHLCIGQEAIYVGSCAALADHDVVFATYRGHGWAIGCGVPLEPLFAELLGRQGGVNGGRGGSAYFSVPDYGFYGENSIVGAGAPLAVGAGMAATFDGSGRVALSAFGDGAMNQGAVHEAMSFASVLDAPVVFVVENNRYSELTPIKDMVRSDKLYRRAAAYGIPSGRVDGNDAEKVRAAVAEAVDGARDGRGPILVECTTERLVGHYIGDAEQYREPGEVEAARQREPLVMAQAALVDAGTSADEVDALEAEVAEEVEDAARAALAQPLADPATVTEHVYG